MPYACSDMTAVTFDMDFEDNEGPRIYLSGGVLIWSIDRVDSYDDNNDDGSDDDVWRCWL